LENIIRIIIQYFAYIPTETSIKVYKTTIRVLEFPLGFPRPQVGFSNLPFLHIEVFPRL
jgi:hypothetical protein